MAQHRSVTGTERFFDDDKIIVSKTDLKGKLAYCNKLFLDIAGYTEKECLGQPHSMIRHPDMPRCVFALMWDAIQSGNEIFAYVINRAKNGDHYWVNAHVTPEPRPDRRYCRIPLEPAGPRPRCSGGHNHVRYMPRFLPKSRRHANRKEGMQASMADGHRPPERTAALIMTSFIATLPNTLRKQRSRLSLPPPLRTRYEIMLSNSLQVCRHEEGPGIVPGGR